MGFCFFGNAAIIPANCKSYYWHTECCTIMFCVLCAVTLHLQYIAGLMAIYPGIYWTVTNVSPEFGSYTTLKWALKKISNTLKRAGCFSVLLKIHSEINWILTAGLKGSSTLWGNLLFWVFLAELDGQTWEWYPKYFPNFQTIPWRRHGGWGTSLLSLWVEGEMLHLSLFLSHSLSLSLTCT